ncbi:bifunctional 2-polyprenyl-6-hydroxyphenol methylase/3-demethylubiquinol 3-O-methyltransferase UbiG [Caulobacter sp. FWC2]|uniref:class I SAM-dependent methyltransferase n=1 Tax=Caulobacter sp. FWC2 TaxID=69664 RepID=UPI001E3E83F2|nr:methyltransferase domain-containing protein [Caulobacter sp. FWC2]
MKPPAAASPGSAAYDAATLRFYADTARIYTATRPDGVSRHLDGFLQRLAPGARVLELGCGDGRDSEAMLARGFDVDATDGAPAIAREAFGLCGSTNWRPHRRMTGSWPMPVCCTRPGPR